MNQCDVQNSIERLFDKDTPDAYKNLLALEKFSETDSSLYAYLYQFFGMINDQRYGVRVRGFRLLAKQAKWDADGKIDKNIDAILENLYDPKPTAVRMKLDAMKDIAREKGNLHNVILRFLQKFDYSSFPESTRGLIKKDVDELVKEIGLSI